jgi:hypothetical protein
VSTYSEKLRDPRWQRRRLEIMSKANFRCEKCFANDITLNVHHVIYRTGADPWDYPDEDLACLCEPCHEREHEAIDSMRRFIRQWDPDELVELVAKHIADFRAMADEAPSEQQGGPTVSRLRELLAEEDEEARIKKELEQCNGCFSSLAERDHVRALMRRLSEIKQARGDS